MEKLNAQALVGGSVGVGSVMGEHAHAEGIYHAIFEGYKAEHEKEYLKEYPRLLKMRHHRDMMMRYTPSYAPELIKTFLAELESFEAYMKSLTEIKRECDAPNTVMTAGKNVMLDAALAGSGYTVVGPFMGLISLVSFTTISAADTMVSHAGWVEAGGATAPTYTAPRKTIAWNAAASGSKSPSTAPVYAFTGPGTVKGVFLSYFTGALSTIDNTAGTLFSAGLFSGGDQAVVNSNTVTVTYSIGL